MSHQPPSPPPLATIKDVAREAGVAFTTVAKILRGERKFKAETIERVHDAVRTLGYRPNRAAAIMASKAGKSRERNAGIAYLTFDQPPLSPGIQVQREAALHRGKELGYQIESVELTDLRELKKTLDQLYHRGNDGLILARPEPDIPWSRLGLDRFSIVATGRANETAPVSCVRPDVVEAVRVSFHKLVQAGCRRIGAALHRHDTLYLDDRDRQAAYLEAWHFHFPRKPVPKLFCKKMRDYAGLGKWVRQEKIDGLIAFSMGDYRTLINQGWRIPEDLQFANLTSRAASAPAVAGVSENYERLHQVAVDLLDQLMRLKIRGLPSWHVDRLMPVTWRDGQSLIAPTRSSS